MELDNSTIIRSALEWINHYSAPNVYEDPLQLYDGIGVAAVFSALVGDFFSTSDIEIAENVDADVAQSNLDTILRKIESYYSVVMRMFVISGSIDTTAIARKEASFTDEIIKLVELLLGIASQCEKKTEYVGVIMTLSLQCQTSLQILMEAIMNRSFPFDADDESSDDKTKRQMSVGELQDSIEEKEREISDLQSTVKHLMNQSNIDVEARKDLELRLQQLSVDLELANHQNSQLSAAEATVERYKQKLEELVPLKRRVKTLEDLNTRHSEKISSLEKNVGLLEDSNSSYEKNISTLEEEIKKLEQEKKVCEDEVATVRQRCSEFEAELKKKNSDINEYSEQIRVMNQTKDEMDIKISALDDEVNQMKEKYCQVENEKKKLEGTLLELQRLKVENEKSESTKSTAATGSMKGKGKENLHASTTTGCNCIIS